MDRERLRATFDEAAELYDRARPAYPEELIRDLAKLADIGPGSRVLEIGAGTGKATAAIAEHGGEVVAVELGADMAAIARRKLDPFPSARVVVSSFEAWPLPPEPFDTVVSATAWHWLDPAVRVAKAARALRPGGALALISTHHVTGGDEEFFAASQKCYLRWDPGTPPGFRLPRPEDVPAGNPELAASGLFGPSVVRRYEREIAYSTREYLDVLQTYSGHRALDRDLRERLLTCIARLIDGSYGGRIRKLYLFRLEVARLKPPAGAPHTASAPPAPSA